MIGNGWSRSGPACSPTPARTLAACSYLDRRDRNSCFCFCREIAAWKRQVCGTYGQCRIEEPHVRGCVERGPLAYRTTTQARTKSSAGQMTCSCRNGEQRKCPEGKYSLIAHGKMLEGSKSRSLPDRAVDFKAAWQLEPITVLDIHCVFHGTNVEVQSGLSESSI